MKEVSKNRTKNTNQFLDECKMVPSVSDSYASTPEGGLANS
jgi:hypothetical protein